MTCRRSTSTSVTSAISTVGVRAALQRARRIGDGAVARRQRARRHLVEQRLEQVVVRAVDQRHVDVGAPQPLRGGKPAEAAADDHDPRSPASPALSRHLPAPAGLRAPIRSSRWSPTRSAFAIAVSAGLTAPMLGKKLVSTT